MILPHIYLVYFTLVWFNLTLVLLCLPHQSEVLPHVSVILPHLNVVLPQLSMGLTQLSILLPECCVMSLRVVSDT